MGIILGISLTINLIVLVIGILFYLYYKKSLNKKKENLNEIINAFGKDNVVDEEAIKDFFNN